MKINRFQLVVLIAACIVTVLMRVQELPMHVDSMIALSLLCGALVRHPAALFLPLGIRLITDVILSAQTGYGYYPSIVFDYAAYAMIAVLARLIPAKRWVSMTAGGLAGPLLFFLISNFGVWMLWPETYAPALSGLLACYAQGLPFLLDSLYGNFSFAIIFLAAWQLASLTDPVKTPVVAASRPSGDS